MNDISITNSTYLTAIKYACTYHALQKYGNNPYYVHFEQIENILIREKYLNQDFHDDDQTQLYLRTTVWLHDILEDTSLSFNDIKKQFGETVAEAVYLLTEYKGKNRKERKPKQYYIDIGKNYYAGIVKLADRISNLENSTNNSMLNMYFREQEEFVTIYQQNPQLFDKLNSVITNFFIKNGFNNLA